MYFFPNSLCTACCVSDLYTVCKIGTSVSDLAVNDLLFKLMRVYEENEQGSKVCDLYIGVYI